MRDSQSSHDPAALGERMARSQDGDAKAYEELLGLVALRIRPYIRSRVRDYDAAEDVVQEVLLSIHRTRATYDPGRPFLPWLWAIVRYRCADHARKLGRLPEVPGNLEDTFQSTHADEDLSGEIESAIKRCLSMLPQKQEQAFTLTTFEGKSIREAAAELQISETATKVTVHRARKSLRKFLREMGYENSGIDP
ncbi:MAG: sigma-70 family RNA polymerase sigma factor [Spirochaetia bacterium]|nr:sigma-70 family RNA polymerase sigma factor [Spirochaetia bacterium]